MGNLQSNRQTDICKFCNDKIQPTQLLVCVRCDISLHESCYNIANCNNTNYTQCPKCERIGCIGKYMIDD